MSKKVKKKSSKKSDVYVKVKKIDLDKLDKKKNKKLKTIIMFIIFILCLFGLAYSSAKIYNWNKNLNENEDIQEDLSDKVKEEVDDTGNPVFYVDFNALKELNNDTVAYLDYKQFNISYVVVKGKDNDYYLNHNFSKKSNEAGWIFADYRNNFDGTDKNIVLFGHSMKNGSMFGSLHKILNDKNYQKEENQVMTFVTPEGTYKYKLFSVYTIDAEDYYITTFFKNKKEWKTFIKKMKSRSIFNFNVNVSEKDTIITLSTCQGYTGNKRLVVQAVRIKE